MGRKHHESSPPAGWLAKAVRVGERLVEVASGEPLLVVALVLGVDGHDVIRQSVGDDDVRLDDHVGGTRHVICNDCLEPSLRPDCEACGLSLIFEDTCQETFEESGHVDKE